MLVWDVVVMSVKWEENYGSWGISSYLDYKCLTGMPLTQFETLNKLPLKEK